MPTYELVTYPTMTTKRTVQTFPSYLDAKHYAHANFSILHFEQDPSVAYDAADFIGAPKGADGDNVLYLGGDVYSIQPLTM